MKDAYYFPHDSNARNDPKIATLKSKYGLVGYALYFCTLEVLREQGTYCYPIRYLLGMSTAIGFDRNDPESDIDFNEFIDYCVELNLLQKDENNIYCESLTNRMQPLENKRLAGKKAAEKRWHDSNPIGTHWVPNASKVKESKVKEKNIYNISKKNTNSKPPLLTEVVAYCKERQNAIDPEIFFDNYESSGWIKANGQKIKDWKATIRTWEKRNQAPKHVIKDL